MYFQGNDFASDSYFILLENYSLELIRNIAEYYSYTIYFWAFSILFPQLFYFIL